MRRNNPIMKTKKRKSTFSDESFDVESEEISEEISKERKPKKRIKKIEKKGAEKSKSSTATIIINTAEPEIWTTLFFGSEDLIATPTETPTTSVTPATPYFIPEFLNPEEAFVKVEEPVEDMEALMNSWLNNL